MYRVGQAVKTLLTMVRLLSLIPRSQEGFD
jgi:hypothetical protein